MKRMSVSFYDEIYSKLETRMQKFGAQSVAQCVRDLVDLGLKIEDAASERRENTEENELLNAMKELKNLLKNNLNWSLETRLLARFLIENIVNGDNENKAATLEKYKESAINYVKGLYGEEDE